MRILLTQGTVYVPTLGGANKSNRLLLEDLASRGHECRVVAPAGGFHASRSTQEFHDELDKRGIAMRAIGQDASSFELGGVRVTAVTDHRKLLFWLAREIRDFDPEWIIVASEDPGQFLLESALKSGGDRIIYLARTTLALPAGPASPIQSSTRLDLLRRAAGIVVVSKYVKNYLQRWGGIASTELPICPNGPGPFPDFGRFDSGFVTMINPCAYKGISIFLELARLLPEVQFAAVPTWGTTGKDMRQLKEAANIQILPATEDVDEIFRLTRILLVPSLWAEAKANVITEAMLRGIPVLAGDAGGNSEATLGVDYLLPVVEISEFRNEVDDRMLPVAIIPPQNLAPWIGALTDLLKSREIYEAVSTASSRVTRAANMNDAAARFEEYLVGLKTHYQVA
jgi:glycosyltransferase involved in cell wall biosynthesis